jgi:hypothetical protein
MGKFKGDHPMKTYDGALVLAAALAAAAFVAGPQALARQSQPPTANDAMQSMPADQMNSMTPAPQTKDKAAKKRAKTGTPADTSATTRDTASPSGSTTTGSTNTGSTASGTVNPAPGAADAHRDMPNSTTGAMGTPPAGMGSAESTMAPGTTAAPPK